MTVATMRSEPLIVGGGPGRPLAAKGNRAAPADLEEAGASNAGTSVRA